MSMAGFSIRFAGSATASAAGRLAQPPEAITAPTATRVVIHRSAARGAGSVVTSDLTRCCLTGPLRGTSRLVAGHRRRSSRIGRPSPARQPTADSAHDARGPTTIDQRPTTNDERPQLLLPFSDSPTDSGVRVEQLLQSIAVGLWALGCSRWSNSARGSSGKHLYRVSQ